MTYSKSVHIERRLNLDKGSSYGITSNSWRSHSFQRSQRGSGLGNQDKSKVLYGETTLFPLQVGSIIRVDETQATKNP